MTTTGSARVARTAATARNRTLGRALRGAAFALTLLVGAGVAHAASYIITDVSPPMSSNYSARSIGAALSGNGKVTGYALDYPAGSPDFSSQAFTYSNGAGARIEAFGGATSSGNGINDAGQATGYRYYGSYTHAFIDTDGVIADLGTLGGTTSTGTAINNAGQVTGSSSLSTTITHAFLYGNGKMTDLGTLGSGTSSSGAAINQSGQVAGSSNLVDRGPTHAFLYADGKMTDLGTLGGTTSRATGINDLGQVVGNSFLSGGTTNHAFVYANGKMTDLGTLGGTTSMATDINNLGQVIGSSTLAGGGSHPFLDTAGVMVDLTTLIDASSGWVLGGATGINDAGQIVGTGSFKGQQRAYLLTPIAAATGAVPEPASWATMIAGMGAIGATLRRRKLAGGALRLA